MVGRAVDQIFPQARRRRSARRCSTVAGLSHPTEFDDIGFDAAPGRDPRLLRPGRRRPQRGHAGAVRHHPRRRGQRRRSTAAIVADPLARRRDRAPASSMCRRTAASRAWSLRPADLPEHHAALARPHLARAASCAGRRSSRWRATIPRGSTCAPPRSSQDVGTLSGGNQQKVVIAKWLATQPKVIILDEPTKGIDIGSKAAVHDFMAELAAQGLAVIMVSLRAARDPRHVRPRRRHARGPHRRRVRRATGSTPRRSSRAAAGDREAA